MDDIKTGTIQITGLADLEKRLQAFPDKIARNILRGAIRAGAVVIQKEARGLAPVSDAPHLLKSGKGRLATWISPGSLKRGVKVRIAPRKNRDRPIEYWVYVSKRLWYWKFVEFGTSKMAARPFLRPAFESQKVKATERIREYLAARIDKEASR